MKHDSRDLAERVSPEARGARGAIRRMLIRFTDKVRWQLAGHKVDGVVESPPAEPFTGIGFYARPVEGGNAEAILASIGDAQHAVIIATRDEDLRKLWADVLDKPDLAAMFNRSTIILINADGTVEIRSRGGTAVELAKASEVQALASAFYAHIHAAAGSPTTAPIADFSLPDPPGLPLVNPGQPGTTVLKGE